MQKLHRPVAEQLESVHGLKHAAAPQADKQRAEERKRHAEGRAAAIVAKREAQQEAEDQQDEGAEEADAAAGPPDPEGGAVPDGPEYDAAMPDTRRAPSTPRVPSAWLDLPFITRKSCTVSSYQTRGRISPQQEATRGNATQHALFRIGSPPTRRPMSMAVSLLDALTSASTLTVTIVEFFAKVDNSIQKPKFQQSRRQKKP